jgi:hypothetical protein
MDALPQLTDAVDSVAYFTWYPDAARRGLSAFEHYDEIGWRTGLDPNTWFSTSKYLARYPDVADANVNPLTHYLTHGFYEGRIAEPPDSAGGGDAPPARGDEEALRFANVVGRHFDRAYYRAQLAARGAPADGIDEIEHYRLFGAKHGLDPNPSFCTARYLADNPDVAAADVHPFVHYLTQGRAEGRAAPTRPVSPPDRDGLELDAMAAEFDAAFYLSSYPDVAQAGVDPLLHYATDGWRESRDPNSTFVTADYLDDNPDVREARMNPFLHYVKAGRAEGRLPRRELGFRYQLVMGSRPVDEAVEEVRRSARPQPRATAGALHRALQLFGRSDGRKLFVSVSHDDYTANVGGVQLCLQREAEAFRKAGYDHLHLYPVVPLPAVETENRDYPIGVLLNDLRVGVFEAGTLERTVREVCGSADVFAERLFAVHSLIGHNGHAITAILKALPGARGFFWVHDYASACSGYNLLRNDAQYCGAPPPTSLACRICAYLPLRRAQIAEHEALFRAFDLTVIAPSQTALDTWRATTEYPHASAHVLEHCRLVPRRVQQAAPAARRDGRLRVAYLGFPAPKKGWGLFKELARDFARDARYEFYHLGSNRQTGVPLRFVGVEVTASSDNAMVRAVEETQIDLAVIWSVCRETFCFTAYEAIAGGAALVVSTESGNAARFAAETENGMALRDERELRELFARGTAGSFARSRRPAPLYDLEYSAMTAHFLNRALV